MERMMGVEPTLPAWEAEVLPMNYIRVYVDYSTRRQRFQQKNCRRVKQILRKASLTAPERRRGPAWGRRA